MEWHDGTVVFKDEARGDMEAKVCIDKPAVLVYSVAAGMSYAVPWSDVTEVTINTSPWK